MLLDIEQSKRYQKWKYVMIAERWRNVRSC